MLLKNCLQNKFAMNDKLKIVLISNVVFEPYLYTYIKALFLKCESQIEFVNVSCDEIDETMEIKNADYVVVCLNFEVLFPDAIVELAGGQKSVKELEDYIVSLYYGMHSLLKQYNNSIILFGLEDYCYQGDLVFGTIPRMEGLIDRINGKLIEIFSEDTYIDLKRLIAKVGTKYAYSSKGKYRWNAPYSKELIEQMSNEIYKCHLRNAGRTKKCLVLDCDNVLWGGILLEKGIEGILLDNSGLGRSYQDFQRFLLELYYRGVILTICSKNDEADVLKVFREHSGMILKEEHIALFCANWNNKSDNIKHISNVLNIGLESIVFVDDLPFEVGAVSTIIPEVKSIIYNRDNIYNDLCCFNVKSKVDIVNIKRRNKTYLTNAKRYELQMSSGSFEEYLNKLEINTSIDKASYSEIARISELTQRSNKCTNGIRYTVNELKEKYADPQYRLWSVYVSDKFSNLGLVGAIGVKGEELDLFVLSCRALGRKIEDQMILLLKDQNVRNYSFKTTKKNEELQLKFDLVL